MSLIVDIQKLQKNIEATSILKLITTRINTGDIIALLGKNGAGKTTFLETMLGFAVPSAGEVRLWDTSAIKIKNDIKQKIGFVPQQNELLSNLNGWHHIELFRTHRKHWNQELVDNLVAKWAVPLDMAVGKMSIGQQQKLSILLAMAHEPQLLVLDEPVASLDPIARRQFLQQLVEIASDENRAVVFSSHIVSDVERVANKVWMLRSGELIFDGDLDFLKENIVRVHIKTGLPLLMKQYFTDAISQRINGDKAIVTFSGWTMERQRQLQEELSADIHCEHLSLEDIFLEMNDGN